MPTPTHPNYPGADALPALYAKHGTIAALAGHLGVAVSTAHMWLSNAGVKVGPPGVGIGQTPGVRGRRKDIIRPPHADLLALEAECEGNRTEMARKLGINRRTVGNWLLEARAALQPEPEPEPVEEEEEPEEEELDLDEAHGTTGPLYWPADRFIAWYMTTVEPEFEDKYLLDQRMGTGSFAPGYRVED